MSTRTPSEHLDSLIELVKALHAAGVEVGWNESRIDYFIGQVLIECAKEVEDDEGLVGAL